MITAMTEFVVDPVGRMVLLSFYMDSLEYLDRVSQLEQSLGYLPESYERASLCIEKQGMYLEPLVQFKPGRGFAGEDFWLEPGYLQNWRQQALRTLTFAAAAAPACQDLLRKLRTITTACDKISHTKEPLTHLLTAEGSDQPVLRVGGAAAVASHLARAGLPPIQAALSEDVYGNPRSGPGAKVYYAFGLSDGSIATANFELGPDVVLISDTPGLAAEMADQTFRLHAGASEFLLSRLPFPDDRWSTVQPTALNPKAVGTTFEAMV